MIFHCDCLTLLNLGARIRPVLLRQLTAENYLLPYQLVIMKLAIFTLLSAAFCALVTSCYYPPSYPQQPGNQPPAPPTPVDNTTATDPGAQQLEAARQRLEAQQNGITNPYNPSANSLPTGDPSAVVPPAPTEWPFATKVPNKPGFVFNPYTKNQVDVRGIPSGTLVRDPYDTDKTHKFRVP